MNWRDNPWFPDVLDLERRQDQEKRPEQYAHIWEGDYITAAVGAYYASEIYRAEAEGRIGDVRHEPDLPVRTAWDLGIGDSTAIWCWQAVGNEVRVIDFYENHSEPLKHYTDWLATRPYRYEPDWLPHDARVRSLETGRTRVETIGALTGRRPMLVPSHKVDDGINAVRVLFPNIWIDRERCAHGIECLRHYRSEFDEKNAVFKPRPVHDWTSHAADAFRYMAMAHKEIAPEPAPDEPGKTLQGGIALNDLWPTKRESDRI